MKGVIARVRLDQLLHNLAAIRAHVRNSARMCFVVKADAYGHGAVRIARAAADFGVDMLAVSSVDEGRELREAGIESSVLLLGPTVPDQAPEIVRWRLTAVCADAATVRAIGIANSGGQTLSVHLEMDAGMHRSGCRPTDVDEITRSINVVDGVRLTGFCTHFPAADAKELAPAQDQLTEFLLRAASVRRHCPTVILHAANSAAIAAMPSAHLDLVRTGLAAYGYDPSFERLLKGGVKPVLELSADVVSLRSVRRGDHVSYGEEYLCANDTVIATIAAGYGDGYPWLDGRDDPRPEVRIGNALYPIAGRVCMDHTMVDVGSRPSVRVGDRAILFGQAGPTAADVSSWAGTISYEVLTRVAPRVPRRYAWTA